MLDSFPVTVDLVVQWSEQDAFGHVNNARYFSWFEGARLALFARVGLPTGGTPAVGPILASTRCDFLAPVAWPATVRAGVRVTRLGRTSFGTDYGAALVLADGTAGTLVARGEGVVVLVNYQQGGTVPIPDDLRGRLQAFQQESSP